MIQDRSSDGINITTEHVIYPETLKDLEKGLKDLVWQTYEQLIDKTDDNTQ